MYGYLCWQNELSLNPASDSKIKTKNSFIDSATNATALSPS